MGGPGLGAVHVGVDGCGEVAEDAVPSSVDAQPCPGGISNTFPAPELLSASSTA